jgi:hypothetical protein
MATGLVNTVTDLVEGLTLAGKKREGRRGEEGGQQHCHPPPVPDEEEEERFVDCPEPSAPPAGDPAEEMADPAEGETGESLFTSWQQCLPSVTTWLQPTSTDVAQFVRSNSQNVRYDCVTPNSSPL